MKKKGKGKRNRKEIVRRQRRMILIGGSVLAVVLIAFLASYLFLRNAVNKVAKDTIWDHVYIETVDVSGLTAEEAKALLIEKEAEYQASVLTVQAEEASAEITLADLGFQIEDVDKLVEKAVSYGKKGSVWSRYAKLKALEKENKVFQADFAIDAEVVATTIAEKIPHLENEAKNASITRENGQFVITDEVSGVAINLEESTKTIETYLNKEWKQETGTIELVTTTDEPEVTREDLETIQDVLGTFTTHCGSGGGRVQNIVIGADHINGAVIMPGEEYSADAAMRPYTTDNGYTEAGSYENGKVVQSMGGGICQVSSTLYNACLLAELEITQRQPHSMMVSYVDPSADAAIAGDYKDLKFKNNTETPIYLEASVSGGYITFTIYGKETRAENRSVKYVSETLSTTPVGKTFVASSDALGTIKKSDSGHTGMKAQLWKVVYEGGVEVSREVINSSTYRASDATYTVGTASDNTEATNIVKNAISSQDEATINNAIAKAKQVIADAKAAAQTPSTQTPTTQTPSTETPSTTTPETSTE